MAARMESVTSKIILKNLIETLSFSASSDTLAAGRT